MSMKVERTCHRTYYQPHAPRLVDLLEPPPLPPSQRRQSDEVESWAFRLCIRSSTRKIIVGSEEEGVGEAKFGGRWHGRRQVDMGKGWRELEATEAP
jgi:hypothetical protein